MDTLDLLDDLELELFKPSNISSSCLDELLEFLETSGKMTFADLGRVAQKLSSWLTSFFFSLFANFGSNAEAVAEVVGTTGHSSWSVPFFWML